MSIAHSSRVLLDDLGLWPTALHDPDDLALWATSLLDPVRHDSGVHLCFQKLLVTHVFIFYFNDADRFTKKPANKMEANRKKL